MREKIKTLRSFFAAETPKKYAAAFAILIVIALILEIFVFNFKWITSLSSEPFTPAGTPELSGAQMNNGEIKITGDSASITYKNINRELKYIYIDPGDKCTQTLEVTLTAVDEANANGLGAPTRQIRSDVPASQYIRLHFSGEVTELKISVSGVDDNKLKGETLNGEIVLNTHVPLMFSWIRFLVVMLGLMLLYLFRPRSFIYNYKTNLKSRKQQLVAAVLVVVQAVCLWQIIHINTGIIEYYHLLSNQEQYYRLVDSFKEGRVDIGDASEDLMKMENPYDTGVRFAKDINYNWDQSYKDGKYYVYFGVVPVLIAYLPYNLVTGKDLPHQVPVFIFCIFIMIGILLLLWEIIKKFYKNTPFAIYLLLSLSIGAGAVFAYAAYKPDLYLVPGTSGVMFGILGLYFWLSSKKDDGQISVPRIAIGSLCIALIAGCRPQILIIILFGVLFFWNDVFKRRTLFSKSGIGATTALCAPLIIVACGIMWYNYARFGSPFDFGANYNLTSNDMTARGFVWGRTGLGIFSYLLQPPQLDAEFPFLNEFKEATTYQGLTLQEQMIGGLIWLMPLGLFAVYGAFAPKIFKNKKIYIGVLMGVIMTVILAVLDAQMAGLLTRYFTDFAWLFLIAAAVTVFELYSHPNLLGQRSIRGIVTALSCVTLVVAFLRLFVHEADSILHWVPSAYYTILHLIAFWV